MNTHKLEGLLKLDIKGQYIGVEAVQLHIISPLKSLLYECWNLSSPKLLTYVYKKLQDIKTINGSSL